MVYVNTNSSVIVIDESELKLILVNAERALQRSREWVSPLGIMLTVIITFLTSDFKTWILGASEWECDFLYNSIFFINMAYLLNM